MKKVGSQRHIMETLRLSSAAADITLAAELLRQGELVAFPTETVYGLGACIFDNSALRNIFTVKGRPADNPLIVHISAPEQAAELARDIPPEFAALAKVFFPGPLAIVLQRNENVPAMVSAGLDTVAIRMPAHPVALQLIAAVGQPLAAPSANRSGRPSPTTVQHVLDDLGGQIAAVLDGGACSVGIESTVLSLTGNRPVILRPGAITVAEISAVLGQDVAIAGADAPVASPGMKYRHYAPNAPVILLTSPEHLSGGGNAILLAAERPPIMPEGVEFRLLTAATLYAELRRADDEQKDAIFVLCSPQIMAQTGLMNRLTKAAAGI